MKQLRAGLPSSPILTGCAGEWNHTAAPQLQKHPLQTILMVEV